MKSVQGQTVLHGSAGTKVDVPVGVGGDRAPGNTFIVTNTGTVLLGLGGADDTAVTCNRCLAVGQVLIIDTADGEDAYLFVPTGNTDGAYDATRCK